MRRLVVAAAIVDDLTCPTRVLGCRRTGPPELAGRWELPGGKVDPGEDPVAALHRELAEELSVRVVLGAELAPPTSGRTRAEGDNPAWSLSETLEMRVWLAWVEQDQVTHSTDHDELRWVGTEAAEVLDWLPGDRLVVGVLVRLLSRPAATPRPKATG